MQLPTEAVVLVAATPSSQRVKGDAASPGRGGEPDGAPLCPGEEGVAATLSRNGIVPV